MSCNTLTATDLKDYKTDNVEFGITVPDFVLPDMVHIDHERVAAVGKLLSSDTLRVVTEAGPVSDRNFAAVLTDDEWMPKLGNTLRNRRDVPTVRVAEGDTSTDRTIDWVILNTSEINDRFQEAEHSAHGLTGGFTQFMEVTTAPIQITWSRFINNALRDGLRELAAEKRRSHRINIADQLGVQILTSGKNALAHGHFVPEQSQAIAQEFEG